MAQFHNAKLYGAQFHGAELFMAQFDGADLRWAQFHDASLWEAQFHGADLQWAQFCDPQNPNDETKWAKDIDVFMDEKGKEFTGNEGLKQKFKNCWVLGETKEEAKQRLPNFHRILK
jgi:uncharacterized protein YjbI with pentapeptide repeats